MIIELGRDGLREPMLVPQAPQKCRVTGFSRSERAKDEVIPLL
ncbi:MAG: hypothetical protein RMX26_10035 [Planktomarina sp.]|nr:hypothetical protein [Planktomarina sp.]